MDKPRIYKRNGWWCVDWKGVQRHGKLTLSEALSFAALIWRSQMIRAAGLAANREADERVMSRPYVNPRAG